MKKTTVALAVLAATGAAMAQSTVTLYGIIDGNLGQQKTTTTTPAGVTTTSKFTGEQGAVGDSLSQSRWGLRGAEDLGGGLRANFNIEQRFTSSDGTLHGPLFRGRSVVGLSGAFGVVDLGREYSPLFWLNVSNDLDGASAFTSNNFFGAPVRRDRSINYTSPSFGGFTVRAQVAGNTASSATAEQRDRGFGLSAVYADGPLKAGLAYDRQKGAPIDTTVTPSAASNDARVKAWELAGSYDLGVAKLYGTFVDAKASQGAVVTMGPLSGIKARELNLGVRVPFGVTELVAGVGRNKLTNAADLSSSGTDGLVGLDYNLSTRTKAYVRTSVRNKLSGGVGDNKNTGLALGVRHIF